MKKPLWRRLVIPVLIIVVIGALLVYFLPMPIIEDVEDCEIEWIKFNPYLGMNVNEDVIEIKNFKEEEIITYLSTCKEQRTLTTSSCYWQANVEIDIMLNTSEGMRHILLGYINYSSEGYGTLEHKILNAEEVRSTLCAMLDLEKLNEDQING